MNQQDMQSSGPAAKPRIVGSGQGEGPGPRLMTAATLTGDDIVNRRGEKLGVLQDIMLDVPNGRIAYAVLSSGGILGIGDKLFAVPWQMLQLDTDHRNLVLDVDKERIERAPGFDKDRWPSMADPAWGTEVHDYYGVRPYWE
jgi:sporulation protein YlmC with PRC-barrel domain